MGSERTDMLAISKPRPTAMAVVALIVLLSGAVGGCNDDGFPPRYPVTGTITYEGKPVESGTITFLSTSPGEGRNAGGTISGGEYSLTSVTPDDGAMAGTYKVTIRATKDTLDTQDEKVRNMYKGAMSTPGVPIPPQVLKNLTTQELVPKKYFDPETSGLTTKVEEKPNTINFDLKD